MSHLKLKGTIVAIKEKQQVTDTFSKREFVIETEEQYPQMIKFELTQNKCDDILGHSEGDEVEVSFNVRGRKWTNKEGEDVYFISLNAWRIDSISQGTSSAPLQQDAATPPQDSFADDLPF